MSDDNLREHSYGASDWSDGRSEGASDFCGSSKCSTLIECRTHNLVVEREVQGRVSGLVFNLYMLLLIVHLLYHLAFVVMNSRRGGLTIKNLVSRSQTFSSFTLGRENSRPRTKKETGLATQDHRSFIWNAKCDKNHANFLLDIDILASIKSSFYIDLIDVFKSMSLKTSMI